MDEIQNDKVTFQTMLNCIKIQQLNLQTLKFNLTNLQNEYTCTLLNTFQMVNRKMADMQDQYNDLIRADSKRQNEILELKKLIKYFENRELKNRVSCITE